MNFTDDPSELSFTFLVIISLAGFEPTPPRPKRAMQPDNTLGCYSRDNRIRTCDNLIPNQVLYQTELHPEK